MELPDEQIMDKKGVRVDVLEYTDEQGKVLVYERFEAELLIGRFDQDPQYKQHCEHCPKYGMNLACPPYSPVFTDYIGKAKTARVICVRLPLEYFSRHADPYEAGHQKAQELLTEELLRYREQGFLVMGSGPCRACKKCVLERGDEGCIQPERRIYSLESLGVNVVALVKEALGFDLEWNGSESSTGYVSAVGAAVSPC